MSASPVLSPRVGRLIVAGALLVLLVGIAAFVRDRFVRPTGGDVLVTAFLYFLLRGLTPIGRAWAAGSAFLFAVGVELTQAAGLAERLGLGDEPLALAVLGHAFDPKDVVAYAVGVGVAALLDRTGPGRRRDGGPAPE